MKIMTFSTLIHKHHYVAVQIYVIFTMFRRHLKRRFVIRMTN